MTISDLKQLAVNRLNYLSSQRGFAQHIGDAQRVASLDAEITQTEQTIAALDSLLV